MKNTRFWIYLHQKCIWSVTQVMVYIPWKQCNWKKDMKSAIVEFNELESKDREFWQDK